MKNWFEVDRKGLARLLSVTDKARLVHELIQNAWDENASVVDVELVGCDIRGYSRLVVKDNSPEGFHDLTHSWTLFADNNRKWRDSRVRGRYNVGEKMVLAMCKEARIETTKGTVTFTEEHGRVVTNEKRATGSVVDCIIKIAASERAQILREITQIIPPKMTIVNGTEIQPRKPLFSFQAKLKTLIFEDDDLRESYAMTEVRAYRVRGDEKPTLYELGLPVVTTNCLWHLEVRQKIPMTLDRTNVRPSYMRRLLRETLVAGADKLNSEQASAPWVKSVMSDPYLPSETFEQVMNIRFEGKKLAAYDPSDPEANNRVVSKGYVLVHGGSLTKNEWSKARDLDLVPSAGSIAPTGAHWGLDGEPEHEIPESKWTDDMRLVTDWIIEYAGRLIDLPVKMRIVNEFGAPYGAHYGGRTYTLNLARLGHAWFKDDGERTERVVDLSIHELAHQFASNHLSDDYYKTLTRLGARSTMLAATDPDFFKMI